MPFTDEEIEIVRICLLNGWEFPPIKYFENKWGESGNNPNSRNNNVNNLNILNKNNIKFPSNKNEIKEIKQNYDNYNYDDDNILNTNKNDKDENNDENIRPSKYDTLDLSANSDNKKEAKKKVLLTLE